MRRAGAAALCLLVAGAVRGETWRPLAGGATDVAVGADGTLWAIGTDPAPGGRTILRWTGQAWETIPGGAVRIAVDPKGAAWVVNEAHIIHRWTGAGWEVVPGGADDVGIGADGTVWVIGGGGTPYRWTGSEWTAIDGGGKEIAVDPKGQPWVVNAAGDIWQRDGAQWKQLPGKGKDLAIAADGTVYALGVQLGRVMRLQGTAWVPVPGATGTRIGAGPKGTVVVAGQAGALAATGTLAAATPLPPASATIAIPPPQQPQGLSVAVPAPVIVAPVPGVIALEAPSSGPAWRALPGGATDVGVGASGVLWAIGSESAPGGKVILRWNGSGWQRMPDGALRIAVDPAGAAWIVDDAHAIRRWNGSAWETMPGGADDIGIGAEGTVWVLGAGAVWRWTGTTWTAIDGAGTSIAVGPDGQPWVVNAGGQIYRRAGDGSRWELLPGAAQDVAVAADGTAYVTGKDAGSVYRFDGTRWIVDPAGGSGARIAAGPKGVVVVASPAGSLLAAGTPAVPAGVQAPPPSGMVATGINLGNTVTSGVPTGAAAQQVGGSSSQGSLGVSGGVSASAPAGTQTSQPLVVTGEYPPSVVPGKLVCSDGGDPTFDPCGKVNALTFGPWKAHLLDCSEGDYDPIFGGSCWKCDGKRVGGTVDSPEACAKERWYEAAWVASAKVAWDCPAQSFWDSFNGGNCYHCGNGHRTTGYAINTPYACSIEEHKPAEFVKGLGCSGLTEWTPGKPRVWVQSLTACMACPVLDQTTGEVLVSEQWMGSLQCKVRFRWTPAAVKGKRIGGSSYADALPGSGELVKEMLADHEQVTAYLKFRAQEIGTPAAEIPALVERQWADLVANPGQSPTVKAMLFARVLGALADSREARSPQEQTVVDGFAGHVQALRQTAAQDAYQMYKAWKKSVDDLRQSRRSNLGDLFSYGTVPLDFDTARQAVAAGTAMGLGGFGITSSYAGYLSNIGSTTIRTLEKARVVDLSRAGDTYVLDRTLMGGMQQSTTKAGTDVVRQVRTVQQVATQTQKAGKVVTVTKNLNGLTQSAKAVTNMIRAGSIADDVANGGKTIVTTARAAIAGVTAAGAGVTIITTVAGILLEIAIDDFVAITTAEQTLKDKVETASQPVVLEDMLDDAGGGTQLGYLWSTMLDAPGNPEPDLVTAAQAAAAAARAAGYPTGATFGDVLGRGTDVARSEEGTVWAIGDGGAIVRRAAADPAWTTLPGNATRVSVGRGEDAWVVNGTGEVYAWRSGNWSKVCSADLTSCGGLGPAADVAVSANGALWVVSRAGKLLRYDGSEWVTVFTPVPAVRVDAAADVLAAIVGNDKRVYVLLGDHWVDLRTPPATDVSIDETGTVWATWVDGALAYLRPGSGLWQDVRLPGSYTAVATGAYPVVVSSSSEIRVANLGHVGR